jgi:hypothetical protein
MPISFTGSYSQNFDTLSNTDISTPWSNDITLPGWSLFRQPAPGTAITTIAVNNGSSATGSFYSYGITGSTDRALGGLGSGGNYFGTPPGGAVAGWIALGATNATGAAITSVSINFDGEQWRNGGNTTAQTMVLEYGLGSDFTTVTSWIDPTGLEWTSPVATSTAATVDGNFAGLVPNVNGTVSLNWGVGETLWLRWIERNDAGNDHGLAIDNFSLSTGVTPPSTPTVTVTATDANAAEAGNDPGTFRIARTGDTTSALTVTYNLTGSTANSNDYTPTLTGTVIIPVGSSFVDVVITPVDDTEEEGTETLILNLVDTSDYDLGGSASATVEIADNDQTAGTIRIHDIQGAAHISPLNGQLVTNVPGIVTAIASNGFYLQDPNPDNDDATSEGIFVFTSSSPTVAVGDSILVSGRVIEFRPGNNADNLTITEISDSPTITVLSSAIPSPN